MEYDCFYSGDDLGFPLEEIINREDKYKVSIDNEIVVSIIKKENDESNILGNMILSCYIYLFS